jgi:hypothetical protein
MQRIIDLDAAVPEGFKVKLDGEYYLLPGDIPIPDFIAIERLVNTLEDPESEASAGEILQELYERALDLFRIEQPDLEELAIGPQRLGALVVGLYSSAAEEDEGKAGGGRPTKAGTRSGKKTTTKRSRGSR